MTWGLSRVAPRAEVSREGKGVAGLWQVGQLYAEAQRPLCVGVTRRRKVGSLRSVWRKERSLAWTPGTPSFKGQWRQAPAWKAGEERVGRKARRVREGLPRKRLVALAGMETVGLKRGYRGQSGERAGQRAPCQPTVQLLLQVGRGPRGPPGVASRDRAHLPRDGARSYEDRVTWRDWAGVGGGMCV